jgi:hypothetical protein
MRISWNAHLKDELENRLHKEMCAGHITLSAARKLLVDDWRTAYRRLQRRVTSMMP